MTGVQTCALPIFLKGKLHKAEQKLNELMKRARKEGEKLAFQAEIQRIKRNISTYKRKSLEARISLLYTRNKLENLKPDNTSSRNQSPEMIKNLRKIGLEFNGARIRKRIDDYLIDCYEERS